MSYTRILLFTIAALFINVEAILDHNGICIKKEDTCTNDCTAVAHCSGRGLMPLVTYCYGSTPYCNRGQCSESYNPHCNQPYNPIYYCPPEDGTYPDPYDCTRFHICLNGKPYSSYCGRPGLVFSTKTLSCVRESNENVCGRINCINNSTWQVYSNDPRYAFLCVNTMDPLRLPGEVIRCKDNYAFNTKTLLCEFKCYREGLFPIYPDYYPYRWNDSMEVIKPNRTSRYIECSLLYGMEYTKVLRNCPNDETIQSVFDPETSQCVLTKDVITTTPPPYITTDPNDSGTSTTNKDSTTESDTGTSTTNKDNILDSDTGSFTTNKDNIPDSETGTSTTNKDNIPDNDTGTSTTSKDNILDSDTGSFTTNKDNIPDSETGTSTTNKDNIPDSDTGTSTTSKDNILDSDTGSFTTNKDNIFGGETGSSTTSKDNILDSNTETSTTNKDNIFDSETGTSTTSKDNILDSDIGTSTTNKDYITDSRKDTSNASTLDLVVSGTYTTNIPEVHPSMSKDYYSTKYASQTPEPE